MPRKKKPNNQRPTGYPPVDQVRQGCEYIAQKTPDVVYITCPGKFHNPGQRKTAALMQVFKVHTLAAQWMRRDIERHNPRQRFAPYRKKNTFRYDTEVRRLLIRGSLSSQDQAI